MASPCEFMKIYDASGNYLLNTDFPLSLHDVLGKKEFKTPSNPPPSLLMRLRSMKDPSKLCFNMANNVRTNDPDNAAEILMNREYPYLEDATSATFIPPIFVPTDPILIHEPDVEHKQEIQKLNQEEKMKKKGKKRKAAEKTVRQELANLHCRTTGDIAERKVYYALEKLLKEDIPNSFDVIVIHGLHISGSLEKQLNIKEQENDIVLLLPRRKLIAPLEIKSILVDRNHAKASIQLQKNMKLLQELFHDLINNSGWHFCSSVYFLNKNYANICKDCDQWTLCEGKDFKEWWQTIKTQFPILDVDEEEHRRNRQKILKAVQLLLFTIHLNLPTTTTKSVEKIAELMAKIGDPLNVLFWSKQQLDLIESVGNEFVLLKSFYGTGKSILMIAKAQNLAKAGKKVLFVIGGHFTKKPTLLQLRMKERWAMDDDFRNNIELMGYSDLWQKVNAMEIASGKYKADDPQKMTIESRFDLWNPSRYLLEFLKTRGDIDFVCLDEWLWHPWDAKRRNDDGEQHLINCCNLKTLSGLWLSLHRCACNDKCLDTTIEQTFHNQFANQPNLQFNLRNSGSIAQAALNKTPMQFVGDTKIGRTMLEGLPVMHHKVNVNDEDNIKQKVEESLKHCHQTLNQERILVVVNGILVNKKVEAHKIVAIRGILKYCQKNAVKCFTYFTQDAYSDLINNLVEDLEDNDESTSSKEASHKQKLSEMVITTEPIPFINSCAGILITEDWLAEGYEASTLISMFGESFKNDENYWGTTDVNHYMRSVAHLVVLEKVDDKDKGIKSQGEERRRRRRKRRNKCIIL